MILEHQRLSQYLFEKTFKVKFNKSFNRKENTVASSYLRSQSSQKLTPTEIRQIKDLNHYDIELYKYAVKLFFERLKIIVRREQAARPVTSE